MKPSQTKEDRQFSQAERGLAAKRIAEDEMIEAWFADHRDALVRQMVGAAVSDDETRRLTAVEIKVVDALWAHIRTEAALGRRAIEELEKRKARQ